MPASTIWPYPSTINNPGGHVITILVDPPSSSYLQKMGCHYLTPSLITFCKVLYFLMKITCYLLYCPYFHVT